MQKLFLTSAGFGNKNLANHFIKELEKDISENRVLMIAYAQEEDQFYVDQSEKELIDIDFKQIKVVNMNNPVDTDSLGNFDIIYVCGGNTYSILGKLRETQLDKFILKQVENNAVYVGVSAGSIIAGESIEIAGWGSEGDENEVGLKDLSGLGFTNIAIFPHFRDELKNEVEEFKNKTDYPVVELTNEQMLFCKDGDCKLVE